MKEGRKTINGSKRVMKSLMVNSRTTDKYVQRLKSDCRTKKMSPKVKVASF